ncbi:MAG TPA: chemotaxis protein CheW [Solirubrobacteraceae bacterium]|nr:chemotaxis protein CheW [Solirubrobacteraceae bacterium]
MSSAEAERQVVVFALLGEHYALPISTVREIIRYTPPRATATASGLIRGMIVLRERLLPLVDLSPLLGGQLEIGAGSRILVVEVSDAALGIVVDAVNGIVHVAPDRVTQLPAAANRELGDEIAAIGDRLIVLLDPERVAVAAGVMTPAPGTPTRSDRGSPESRAAPSDPPR